MHTLKSPCLPPLTYGSEVVKVFFYVCISSGLECFVQQGRKTESPLLSFLHRGDV